MDCRQNKVQVQINEYTLFIPTNLKFEVYNEPENFYGVIMYYGSHKYDVISSKLGARLLISGKEGEIKDLPFHKGTMELLPSCVKVSQ